MQLTLQLSELFYQFRRLYVKFSLDVQYIKKGHLLIWFENCVAFAAEKFVQSLVQATFPARSTGKSFGDAYDLHLVGFN
jgi:hypothetical protein